MVDRVKKIIKEKNLTSSGFADKIGVPRSTISHILSGRNNPSLELLQKILDNFPDVRTEWLIRGRGEMFMGGARDLFSFTEEDNQDMKDEINDTGQSGLPDAVFVESGAEKPPEEVERAHKEEKEDEKVKLQRPGKKIESIIVLYRDGTFSSYGHSAE